MAACFARGDGSNKKFNSPQPPHERTTTYSKRIVLIGAAFSLDLPQPVLLMPQCCVDGVRNLRIALEIFVSGLSF